MSDAEDQKIIKNVLKGKKQAYGLLIKKYQKPIFNIMLRATADIELSTDLTQETFLKAYAALKRFDPKRRFFSWLYTIGINAAKDFTRRQRLTYRYDQNKTPENTSTEHFIKPFEATGGHPDDMIDMTNALSKLSVPDREALLLRYREGFSIQEIADVLDISLSAAKMRIHRALEKIRTIYNEDPGA